jgi:hypothetical protein
MCIKEQTRQCRYNAKQRLFPVTIVAAEKQSLLHICIKCIKTSNKGPLVLRMLFLMGIHYAALLSLVASPALQTFSTLPHKRDDSR